MSVTTASFIYYEVEPISCVEPSADNPGTITNRIIVERKPTGSPAVRAPVAIPDDVALLGTEGVIPPEGDVWPGAGTWHALCRFRNCSYETLPGGLVQITLNWSTRYIVDPVTGNADQMPIVMEYGTRVRSTTIFRSGWSVSPPASLNASTTDIGGTSLKSSDEGSTIDVAQCNVRLRAVQDATVTTTSAAASTLSSYVGKINSATFCGFAAYSLVCTGLSINKLEGEFYEVIFEFLFDQWYHHEQTATIAADGRPIRTSAGELSEVKWKRLARTSTDFNNIFGGDARLQLRAENGWWA
jgi:hypothetical protein